MTTESPICTRPRVAQCAGCAQPLPQSHRKYCAACSPHASALWKRSQRIACKGSRYWLDPFLARYASEQAAVDAYREDCRARMRRYREKQCASR